MANHGLLGLRAFASVVRGGIDDALRDWGRAIWYGEARDQGREPYDLRGEPLTLDKLRASVEALQRAPCATPSAMIVHPSEAFGMAVALAIPRTVHGTVDWHHLETMHGGACARFVGPWRAARRAHEARRQAQVRHRKYGRR